MGRREFAKQLTMGCVLGAHMYGKVTFMATGLHVKKEHRGSGR